MLGINLDSGTIAAVLSGVIILITAVGGGVLITKAKEILAALKESGDVVIAVRNAIDDNKITAAEIDVIVAEINEAKGALSGIFVKREEESLSESRVIL